MDTQTGIELDALGVPYPGDVGRDREKQRRWDLAAETATAVSATLEPSGLANPHWVWMATRSLYDAPIATG